ncbi:MAG: hypothetical protein O2779_01705 [Nanoarchaeota archaeon]|nr:hypothetical protein [Nanoarchaeota archaeon]
MKVTSCILLLVALFAVGCSSVEQVEETDLIPDEVDDVEVAVDDVEVDESPVESVLSDEVAGLLEKSLKLKSYSYSYDAPGSSTIPIIDVKGKNIKIAYSEVNVDDRDAFYHLIYIDTEAETAVAYCTRNSDCNGKVGKTKDLVYADVVPVTPVDWLQQVTTSTKLGERRVEDRDTLILDTNIGALFVESYYGFLYQIEKDGERWVFSDASFNSVKDSEVLP